MGGTSLFEVESVDAGSPAERAGLKKGDRIVSVNGEEFIDYIDYVWFSAQDKLKISVEREGEIKTLTIRKSEVEALGLEFTQPLLGRKRVCGNKCVFCFVDQLPRGMRKSLYLKDEDWRYSLVMGNFVTLSTIKKEDADRIIRRQASPLYISVHTVDEELRKTMLGNPDPVPIKPLLKRFATHGISFHAQVVLCPGYNDGEKLHETYSFLKSLYPAAASLAVVPVGLTGFRTGLRDVKPVSKQDAEDIIKRVENWQKECLNKLGTRFVFAADEFYIKAGAKLPPAEDYEAFPQIENGVGMLAKFISEATETDLMCAGRSLSIATGEDAYPFFKELASKNPNANVYSVKNLTFGGGVTVSGLLGGKDYLKALTGKDLGEALLISADSLREDVFLDDMKLSELEQALGVKIFPVADGYEFAELLCSGR
jgi:putative radical SAM enzyme (TIGR03279 family)